MNKVSIIVIQYLNILFDHYHILKCWNQNYILKNVSKSKKSLIFKQYINAIIIIFEFLFQTFKFNSSLIKFAVDLIITSFYHLKYKKSIQQNMTVNWRCCKIFQTECSKYLMVYFRQLDIKKLFLSILTKI